MAHALPATLNQSNALAILHELQTQGVEMVDASALTQVDASALALLLALRRQQCVLNKLPAGILQLAKVYGVEDVFLAK